MPNTERPTLTMRPTITIGGVEWVPDLGPRDKAEWYYHAAEGQVFPYSAYHRLHGAGHGHHAVMPVRPA